MSIQPKKTLVTGVAITIPEGSNVLSLGNFLYSRRLPGITLEIAGQLDLALSELPFETIKTLGMVCNISSRQIADVYRYNEIYEKSNKIDTITESLAANFPNYTTFVGNCTLRTVPLITAVSKVNSEIGDTSIDVRYDDGDVKIKIGSDYVSIPDATNKCEEAYKITGENVVVEHVPIIQKYAAKVYSNESVRAEFLKSDAKEIGSISLKEVGGLFFVGRMKGTYRVDARPERMDPKIKKHITSETKELAVYLTSRAGVNKSGQVIDQSNIFMKNGLDIFNLGIKKNISEAILDSLGVNHAVEDATAHELFDKYIFGKREDVLKPNQYLLYNPGWLSKEYSSAKGNKDRIRDFADKYFKLFLCRPLYVGVGTYKYIIKYDNKLPSADPALFMGLPSAIEKMVGYYTLAMSVCSYKSFQKVMELFFLFNKNDMIQRELMNSLQLAFGSYSVKVPFQGVKKNTESSWGDDKVGGDVTQEEIDKAEQYKDQWDDEEAVIPLGRGSSYKKVDMQDLLMEKEISRKVTRNQPRSRNKDIDQIDRGENNYERNEGNRSAKGRDVSIYLEENSNVFKGGDYTSYTGKERQLFYLKKLIYDLCRKNLNRDEDLAALFLYTQYSKRWKFELSDFKSLVHTFYSDNLKSHLSLDVVNGWIRTNYGAYMEGLYESESVNNNNDSKQVDEDEVPDNNWE